KVALIAARGSSHHYPPRYPAGPSPVAPRLTSKTVAVVSEAKRPIILRSRTPQTLSRTRVGHRIGVDHVRAGCEQRLGFPQAKPRCRPPGASKCEKVHVAGGHESPLGERIRRSAEDAPGAATAPDSRRGSTKPVCCKKRLAGRSILLRGLL